MTTTNTMTEAKLYWDDQDSQNTGWWLRYRDEAGTEQGCAVDGDEDATTEELAAAVAKECDGCGRITVIRGEQARGSIEIADGAVVNWRAS